MKVESVEEDFAPQDGVSSSVGSVAYQMGKAKTNSGKKPTEAFDVPSLVELLGSAK
jgi:hypothetical protein